jgi:hypothetical protein
MNAVIRYEQENDLRDRVVEDTRNRFGIIHLRINYDGFPDTMFLFPTKPFFVEFKRSGERPRKLQEARMGYLRAIDYDVAWFDNYDAAWTAIVERAWRR